MRTQLEERHRPLFAALSAEQTERVCQRVRDSWSEVPRDYTISTPGALFEACREAGLDHARVVLSLARETDAVGRGAIEVLVGRPIRPWATSVEAEITAAPPGRRRHGQKHASAAPPAQAKPLDTRVVLSVQPCPYRAGTYRAQTYGKWQVGATVAACLAAGLERWSMRRDLARGYVVVCNMQEGRVDS